MYVTKSQIVLLGIAAVSDVDKLRGGILSSGFNQHLLTSGMLQTKEDHKSKVRISMTQKADRFPRYLGLELGDVVHLVVDDHPQVGRRIVLCHLGQGELFKVGHCH